MKTKLTLFLIFIISLSFSQNTTVLDYNNVSALLKTNGMFFNNQEDFVSGYTVPKDSNTRVIYSSSFWFGAEDTSGTIHLAAKRYGLNQDYFCGPISNNYNHTDYINMYNDRFWEISKTEILNHKANYWQVNYTVPTIIAEWPANGDNNLGVQSDLAPYVDFNSNGYYDPENGDYPNIRGDMAVYLIMNDDAGIHAETGGESLKMEFHYMFYQYSDATFLNNTTFINLKVINRSQIEYTNFKVAYFIDHDIGGASDDFTACNPSKNLMIGYNGDNYDDGSGGATYGLNPPAVGIKFLNHNLDIFGSFNSLYPTTDPVVASGYWSYVNANWGNSGFPFTEGGLGYNGTIPTNYIYSGSLMDTTQWSEITSNNPPGDRRMFGVSEPIYIIPNQTICYDYAVLYNRSGTNSIENAIGLNQLADEVQSYYDDQVNFSCQSSVLGVNKLTESKIKIFPNPSNGKITITAINNFSVAIYNINGEIVYRNNVLQNTLDLECNEPAGIYFVKIQQGDAIHIKKIIIN